MLNDNRMLRLVPLLSLVLLLSAGGAGAKDKVPEKKFDFTRTRAFIGEMETRPDFPVSMVLANDYVYSFLATGKRLDTPRKNSLIAYIKSSQRKDGGFTGDPANKDSSVLYTSFALETLGYLYAGGAVDAAKIRSFVAALKNADGGFGFSQQARKSSLATTYYAVRILKGTGGVELVDKAKTAAYLKGFERPDGGFGYVKGTGVADAKSTYMAVFSLDALGMLDPGTAKSAVKFLATTPYAKGKNDKKPELDQELYAVKALKLLRVPEMIDKKFAVLFMKKIYIPVNGGFGPMEGYGSTPDSTASALRVLAEVGDLKVPAELRAGK